jgi:hypothetical protein
VLPWQGNGCADLKKVRKLIVACERKSKVNDFHTACALTVSGDYSKVKDFENAYFTLEDDPYEAFDVGVQIGLDFRKVFQCPKNLEGVVVSKETELYHASQLMPQWDARNLYPYFFVKQCRKPDAVPNYQELTHEHRVKLHSEALIADERYRMFGATSEDGWKQRFWGSNCNTYVRRGGECPVPTATGAAVWCRYRCAGNPRPILMELAWRCPELVIEHEAHVEGGAWHFEAKPGRSVRESFVRDTPANKV